MSEPAHNGFRDPFRYIMLALLMLVLIGVGLNLHGVRVLNISSTESAERDLALGRAVEKLVVATDIQTYVLDQLLPEGRRIGLGRPPALWQRLQKGQDFQGDPWQRRRPATPGDERVSPLGGQAP